MNNEMIYRAKTGVCFTPIPSGSIHHIITDTSEMIQQDKV